MKKQTCLFLHAADAVTKGCRKLYVRTVDTDIVTLAISTFNEINPDELWLAFGTGMKFHHISFCQVVTKNLYYSANVPYIYRM